MSKPRDSDGVEVSVQGVLKTNSKILEAGELKRLDKAEKAMVTGSVATAKDIRIQLNDQLRCLDGRLESQQGIVTEIQDIFRRRAEIELNYSRDLDKLAKLLSNRHKEQKQKRESWNSLSSLTIWTQLVNETRKAGKDHAAIAEIYNTSINGRCNQLNEDICRIYRKCREIGFEIHEEVLKVLHELHTAMKTHHTYQSEFRQAESKLQVVEKQRTKLKDQIPKEKLSKSRKYRLIEKEVLKRSNKYTEARLKATKARNEYLLCMDAANSSIHKYFVDDLSDLMDCMDFGFHQSLSRVALMRSSAMDQLRRTLQQEVDGMNKVLGSLDSRLDKKKFLEKNDQAFMIPKKFEYQPVRRDESELIQKPVLEELESRKTKLAERLSTLRTESEEIWKSLETAEKTLLDMVNCADYDTTRFFVEEETARRDREPESIVMKQRADRHETEQFYLQKFREYILNSNRISRLQAKYDHIRKCLGDQQAVGGAKVPTLPRPTGVVRRRIGRTPLMGQPKLFGGCLEEFLEATNQEVPIVVKSCIRVINLYGLHHQGIFRVSGSQVEINNFRESFERGEDPLADMTDASDINSVAGVMKLFLRELREPVFSVQYFDQFMELAKLESKHEFVLKVRDLVKTWPRPTFVVMRYLFSFLNHLSEYSDENMMDPYNLAICFGPTLVPIPTDRDQVQYQNLVNELIKNFIIFNEDIFPNDGLGITYEKYISKEPEDVRAFNDNDDDNAGYIDEDESEVTEDDSVFPEDLDRDDDNRDISIDCFGKSEVLEAHAQYDFTARSSREVSFRKGDTILLYAQVSGDWWRGSVDGREGLIPDKYILLKIRGEDDQKESFTSISSDEARRRASSQSEPLRSRLDQSPRPTPRSNNSLSGPPLTPPSSRSIPHRHSLSVAPSATPPVGRATVIAVPTFPTTQERRRTSSRESLSVDSGNPSPDNTFTSERASRSPAGQGSESDSRSADFDSLSVDDSIEDSTATTTTQDQLSRSVEQDQGNREQPEVVRSTSLTASAVTSAATTVIHVTAGPAGGRQDRENSFLDETVVSATTEERIDPSSSLVHEVFSSGPSDRLLKCGAPARLLGSQDSLASTGSNQELKSELDTTLDAVKAVVADVEEKQRLVSPDIVGTEDEVMELVGMKAGSREGVGRKLSHPGGEQIEMRRKAGKDTGARPRSSQAPVVTPRTKARHEQEGILLKQSSWGSREPLADPQDQTHARVFMKNRDLWEKRAGSSPSSDEEKTPVAFRSNREFWEKRVRQKQTPDLVLDLPPASSLASTSPPVPAPRPRIRHQSQDSLSSASPSDRDSRSSSSPGHSPPIRTGADHFAAQAGDTLKKSTPTPVPKPRPDPLVLQDMPRSQVVPIRSPGPRTPKLLSKFQQSGPVATPQSPFQAATSSFKPAVKVKPVMQVRPTDTAAKDLK